MKKIKTIEKAIVNFATSNLSADPTNRTFRKMMEFWEIYDCVFHTNHAAIIKILYSSNVVNESTVCKSIKVNVSERTLTRYRKLYVKCFYAIDEIMLHRSAALTDADDYSG